METEEQQKQPKYSARLEEDSKGAIHPKVRAGSDDGRDSACDDAIYMMEKLLQWRNSTKELI